MADRPVNIIIQAKDKSAAGLKQAEGNLERLKSAAGTAAKVLGGLALATGAVGVRSAMMAADFQKGMAEVATLSADVQKQLPKLSEGVLELSRAMGQDATQSAKGLYQAISAGVPAENALKFLEVASKAAIGGVTDTETAVDGLSTVLNAFKLPTEEAARVADVMFTAVKQGKTDFEQLSSAMFNVAPLAASLGVGFEEVAAATATLTKSGTPTSVAMTQMRAAMNGLIKPSDELTKIFQAAGHESAQAALDSIGLQGSLELVREATGGNVGELTKLLGSVEAVSATLGLTGENAEVFRGDLEAMTNSAGASEAAFKTMSGTLDHQMKVAQKSLDAVFITIGTELLPVLTPLVTAFAEWLPEAFKAAKKKVDELRPTFENIRTAIGKVADVAIPALAGALTFMRQNWDVIGPAIAAVALWVIVPAMVAWAGAAIAAAAATILALLPILVPLALVGAAAAALALAWRENFLDIQGKTKVAIDFIGAVFDAFIRFMAGWGLLLIGLVKGAIGAVVMILNGLIDAWNFVAEKLGLPILGKIEVEIPMLNAVEQQLQNLARPRTALISVATAVGPAGGAGINFGNAIAAARGFDGMVSSPTLFLAGEAGREHVRVTPAPLPSSPSPRQGDGDVHQEFHFHGPINVRTEDDIRRIAVELDELRRQESRRRGFSMGISSA